MTDEQRGEARVADQNRFVAVVAECPQQPELVGQQFDCEAVDFSIHGMQFKTSKLMPAGTQLNLRLDTPLPQYQLRGELRWIREKNDGCFVGLLLVDDSDTDFNQWKKDLEERLK